jgi:hypothetical protein
MGTNGFVSTSSVGGLDEVIEGVGLVGFIVLSGVKEGDSMVGVVTSVETGAGSVAVILEICGVTSWNCSVSVIVGEEQPQVIASTNRANNLIALNFVIDIESINQSIIPG